MFGMILVEPEEGLPGVDRELYFGQHELYTDKEAGAEGHHGFDMDAMAREDPTYVVLNGEKYAWAAARHGPLGVDKGDTVRVFLVCGGPTARATSTLSATSGAGRAATAMKVPPGSCMIGEMETRVPERIKLVDHALSRVVRKGLLAEVDVVGGEDEDVYDPDFRGSSHEGPMY
jgi:nitrite reductase (NO-forming)